MESIDYSRLQKALLSYKDTIDLYNEYTTENAEQRKINSQVAAVIQNFEFTIEIAWKSIQKWLIEHGAHSNAFESKGKMFKIAAEEGLIDDPEAWLHFYRSRNLSSHTYGEEMAQTVFQTALSFYQFAEKLNQKINNA